MKIRSPLYLIESKEICWKCHLPQRVICLATPRIDDGEGMDTLDAGEEDEPILFKNVQHLDPLLESWFSANEPNYRHHFSRKAGIEYLANLCPGCGANFGDHFLHEMGGAFSPMEPQEAELMGLGTLPFHGEFEIAAEWVMGVGELLLEFAQRH